MALFDNRLLAGPQVETMLSTRALPGDARAPFAAGWAPGASTFGAPMFTNNGSMEGTSAIMAIVPERRAAVVILANRERFVPQLVPLLRETLRAALGLPSQ
jgi:CubicO group peptidase (beta-lactamase class C family)